MRTVFAGFGLVLVVLLTANCGGSEFSSCTTNGECLGSHVCTGGVCKPPPTDGGGQGCGADIECGGGKCLDGICCASLANVCGSLCCASTETCFGSACVLPGKECTRSSNCESGEYCEFGLGLDAGADAGVGECTGDKGRGRCLALPPECASPPSGEPCVLASCEIVHRDSSGPLNAVPQWRWGPDEAVVDPTRVDVWSTPVVGRIVDTNCDGVVDDFDNPAIVFVANDTASMACQQAGQDKCRTAILRAIDGSTGKELWSLAGVDAQSAGFAGISMALGDLDHDGVLDIVVATAERHLAAIKGDGTVMGVGSAVLPMASEAGFGWGGGLALGDMDGDGKPEVAWRGSVYTWSAGTFTTRFEVPNVRGGWAHSVVSTSTGFFVDLDSDPDLELLAGNTAINADGSILWQRSDLADGFAAIADFDKTQPITPEVVLVSAGQVYLLNAATGATIMGPAAIGGTGAGGPPTVADFDNDGFPEIGVAQATVYAMLKPNFATSIIEQKWATTNHDNSSSVTGSTVFDFEGDGIAEVVYNDECFMWVFDGRDGRVRFSAPTNSFTGTESSLVADVDGDGRAEMLMIANGADPTRWHCTHHGAGAPTYPEWTAPSYGPAWRGISVFRDASNAWVGTRALWSQHAYNVTNTCSGGDSACEASTNTYGAIPPRPKHNWAVSWLNNFRQNVQESGLFDAPDAVLALRAHCSAPVRLIASLRNQGRAKLPAGVVIAFFRDESGTPLEMGRATSTSIISPGGIEEVVFDAPVGVLSSASFSAKIVVDSTQPGFEECDDTNNSSATVSGSCVD